MLIAVDTETTGITRACRPFIVSACSQDGETSCWQWRVNPDTRMPHIPAADVVEIGELLWSNTIVFHNTKFDVRMLDLAGIIDGEKFLRQGKYEDTLIASHCLNSWEEHTLKILALKYLDMLDTDEKALQAAVKMARRRARGEGWRVAERGDPYWPSLRTATWPNMDYWLPREVALRLDDRECNLAATYAVKDVERTIGLWQMFQPALEEEELWEHYVERRELLAITYEMEERGVPLHMTRTKRLTTSFRHQSQTYAELAAAIPEKEINLASHAQLRGYLYYDCGLPIIERTKGGMPSTNAAVLLELMEQAKGPVKDFIRNLLFSRKLDKAAEYLEQYYLHATYSDAYRLHGNLNITGTHTTRFSASFPNTQNISKGENPLAEYGLDAPLSLRQVFGPIEGRRWYAIDYKQLQIVIFAYATGEQELLASLLDGFDAHDFTAKKIFPGMEIDKFRRRIAKNVNFGFIFGASPKKIEQTAGMPGLWDVVIQVFPHAHKFIQATTEHVREHGYVETLDGYRVQVPADKPYAGVNYIVQGTEGRVVQRAMKLCDDFLQDKPGEMIMNIHDELVFDCPDEDESDILALQLGLLMEAAGQSMDMKLGVDIERCVDSLNEGEAVHASHQC